MTSESENISSTEVCSARIYAGRLSRAMNASGFSASQDAIARGDGLQLPRCWLNAGHEGAHMLDPAMWTPPEPPPTPTQSLRRWIENCRRPGARMVPVGEAGLGYLGAVEDVEKIINGYG